MLNVDDLPPLARRQPHLALILVGDVIAAAHGVVDKGAGVGAGAVGADALAVVVLARAGDADAAEQAKALAAAFWKGGRIKEFICWRGQIKKESFLY